MPWQDDAACRGYAAAGKAWWWSSQKEEKDQAIEICRSCPVRAECLEFATENKMTDMIMGGEKL